jgi:ketosteroid isomerase-like protein
VVTARTVNNKTKALRVVNAMVGNDIEALGQLLSENVCWNIPESSKRAGLDNRVIGRAKIADVVRGAHAHHYKHITAQIQYVFGEDDMAAVLCRMDITSYKTTRFENQYVYVIRFENGLVAEAWELIDTALAFEKLML